MHLIDTDRSFEGDKDSIFFFSQKKKNQAHMEGGEVSLKLPYKNTSILSYEGCLAQGVSVLEMTN